MSEKTGIEWCDSTFNPWIGCTAISPACDNCYAKAMMDDRLHVAEWGPGKPRTRTSSGNWRQPLKWNRDHEAFFAVHGRRRRVFCASLADVFDNEIPWQWRLDLFSLIRDTPNIDWLLLTKRLGNVGPMLSELQVHGALGDVFPNVWLGATICNQPEADRDLPRLLRTQAAVLFLSVEPLLGPIDLYKCGALHADYNIESAWSVGNIDWVVVGGESGKNARPMQADWARTIRDQCQSAGVPFFFKQWGEWLPDNQNPAISGPSGASQAIRVGKKLAGRLLDGREWNEYPVVTA